MNYIDATPGDPNARLPDADTKPPRQLMTQQQPDSASPSPWTRPWLLASAGFLALACAAGTSVVLWPGGDDQVAVPPAASVPVTPGGVTASVPPTAIPSAPPSDVRWELFGQSAVPVSAAAGPRDTGAGRGYARTPDGALIATQQLSVRAGHSAGRASWEPTITTMFVPSEDRDKLLATLRAAPEPDIEPGDLSPLVGYRFVSYTPDAAVIELVYRARRAGDYFASSGTLVWQDGDWRMQAPLGGSWLSVHRRLLDLTGVTTWGAR